MIVICINISLYHHSLNIQMPRKPPARFLTVEVASCSLKASEWEKNEQIIITIMIITGLCFGRACLKHSPKLNLLFVFPSSGLVNRVLNTEQGTRGCGCWFFSANGSSFLLSLCEPSFWEEKVRNNALTAPDGGEHLEGGPRTRIFLCSFVF